MLKVEKIDVNAKGSKKRTPLHIATDKGNKNITKALIGAKANVDVKDNYGKTPLDLAINQDIEKLLVAAVSETANECTQINKDLSDSGIGPELLQTENNNTTQNSSVTNEQQNKSSKIMEGGSLLHFNAFYELKTSLECLLKKKKFDVNKKNDNGHTPLHIAYQNNQLEIVSLLRKYGASVDVKDNYGKTPLDLSRQNLLKADGSQDFLWDNDYIEQGYLHRQVCTTSNNKTPPEENLDSSWYEDNISSVTSEVGVIVEIVLPLLVLSAQKSNLI